MKVSTANILMSVMVLALAACGTTETHKHKRHAARPATSGVEAPTSGGCASCGVVSGAVESKPAPDAATAAGKENAQTQ